MARSTGAGAARFRAGHVKLAAALLVGVVQLPAAAVAAEGPTADNLGGPAEQPAALSATARDAAEHAVAAYGEKSIATLADLVRFRSVHVEGTDNAANPEFRAMTEYLAGKAAELGLDFSDHGAVVLIGLGEAAERLGIIAHADVQPADPSKWASDPFTLDAQSEPGRLVGRGAEDDKGPLATALYAMKAVADTGRPMTRRIELIVSYTEESDWGPFQEFLAGYDPPAINFALDAVYPVVTAEKGWGEIHVVLPIKAEAAPPGSLVSISGGSFLSQVPEDAEARIAGASPELEAVLRVMATGEHPVTYTVARDGEDLVVRCRGVSAHSMDPWEGRNAITHLADLLGRFDWPDTTAARMVRWINDLVGTGDFAEKFGELAYEQEFMGPLTLTLATVVADEDRISANLSFRRPAGRSADDVESAIRAAVDGWKERTGTEELDLMTRIFDPYLLEDAPHVATLLEVFRHYTGLEDAGPVAIGGGTNARLLPNGVSFGPSMPGETYTGHSEHEFITRDQFLLNLKMYTAALAELGLR